MSIRINEMSAITLLLIGTLLLTGCAPTATPTPAQIANPASQNCIDKGGTLTIEERGDGGQYGVCFFEDNRQCEEWALYNGDCPVGGLKVTGYITPAAQYCAITGGTYTVTGNSNTENEQGTCAFKDGSSCDAWAYYNGTCDKGNTLPASGINGRWTNSSLIALNQSP
jgi:putative hemolysin